MKLHIVAVALASLALQAHANVPASDAWQHLWRNADQRGEAKMQQGNPADAAKEYADPQRKGYAAFKAGDFAGAARTLSGVDAVEAQYNRGNALAYAGDLQGALNAYDAALKHEPQHHDARKNRDLVAKAMQEKKDEQKQDTASKDKDKDKSKNGQKDGKDDRGKTGQSGNQQGGNTANKPDDKPGGKSANQQGSGNGGKQDANSANKPDGKSDGKSADQPAGSNSGKQDASAAIKPDGKSGGKSIDQQASGNSAKQDANGANIQDTRPGDKGGVPSSQQAQAPSPDDAAQARQDAETGLNALNPSKQDAHADGAASHAGGAQVNPQMAATDSLSEKQLAQDQWLRSIPDDPGGLLRRKFLIEHLRRQRSVTP